MTYLALQSSQHVSSFIIGSASLPDPVSPAADRARVNVGRDIPANSERCPAWSFWWPVRRTAMYWARSASRPENGDAPAFLSSVVTPVTLPAAARETSPAALTHRQRTLGVTGADLYPFVAVPNDARVPAGPVNHARRGRQTYYEWPAPIWDYPHSRTSEAIGLSKNTVREHGREHQGRPGGKPEPFHGRLLQRSSAYLSTTDGATPPFPPLPPLPPRGEKH